MVARRSQDQAGDLATTVEESVHGIRVLKAFGRGKYALRNFESQAELLRGTEIEKAKAIAGIWLFFLRSRPTAEETTPPPPAPAGPDAAAASKVA